MFHLRSLFGVTSASYTYLRLGRTTHAESFFIKSYASSVSAVRPASPRQRVFGRTRARHSQTSNR